MLLWHTPDDFSRFLGVLDDDSLEDVHARSHKSALAAYIHPFLWRFWSES
jgi:hypothetical protein